MDDWRTGEARSLAQRLSPTPGDPAVIRRQGMAQQLLGVSSALPPSAMNDPAVAGWAQGFQQRHGQAPNTDDPSYNYGMAFGAGARPEPYAPDGGAYHWPSTVPVAPMGDVSAKAADHPSAWMETFMQRYGTDPNSSSPADLVDGYLSGVVPPRRWE